MNKKYLYILITYIAMQMSAFIGMPLLFFIGTGVFNVSIERMEILATGLWLIFSFITGLVVVLLILKRSKPHNRVDRVEPMPIGQSILWAIGGIFLAFFTQYIAIVLEMKLGIDPGSENTEQIMNLIRLFPLAVLVSSIIGPILEEIVFRKVIFGSLYNRFPFWLSALLSSLTFAVAHMDFTHILIYTAMGFTFAFLYVHTKRIIVPIISHAMMNTLVTVAQFSTLDNAIHVQGWIRGLLW